MRAETHLEVYRPFTGKLREHPLRFVPLWTTGLRTALKQLTPITDAHAVEYRRVLCHRVIIDDKSDLMLHLASHKVNHHLAMPTGTEHEDGAFIGHCPRHL